MSVHSDPYVAHIYALAQPDPKTRQNAIKMLGELRDMRAVPVLMQMLEAKEAAVRGQAARALGKLSHPQAIEPLIRIVQTDSAMVRRQAVAALGRISADAILPALVAALTDPDPKVMEIAARALEKRGDRRAVAGLRALVEDPERIVSTKPRSQWNAFEYARAAAICALGSLRDPDAIPTLIGAFAAGDGIVQDTAILAMADLGDVGIPVLLEALQSEDTATRWAAVKTLERMRCVRAAPSVIPLLKDPATRVRGYAARYLGQCGDPQAIPALAETIENTGDEGPAALLKFGESGREALRAVLARIPTRTHSILVSIRNLPDRDARFVPPLVELLRSESSDTRIAAARMLAYYRDDRAVPPLIAALRDGEKLVRQEIVQALGQIGDVRAVDPLIHALNDREWFVRCRAIDALADIGDARAVEPLLRKLKREVDPQERRLAARRLGDFQDARIVEPLLAIADDPEDEIGDMFPAALGKLGDSRALAPLLRILQSDDRVLRTEAANALGKLGDRSAVGPIVEALQQKPQHSAELVLALGNLGDQAAVDAVTAALARALAPSSEQAGANTGEESTCVSKPFMTLTERVCLEEYGLQALGKLKATASLLTYLQHRSVRVRTRAAHALGEAGDAGDVILKALRKTLADEEKGVQAAAKKALRKLGAKGRLDTRICRHVSFGGAGTVLGGVRASPDAAPTALPAQLLSPSSCGATCRVFSRWTSTLPGAAPRGLRTCFFSV